MVVLYVGPILEGSTSLQRLRALRDMGHSVSQIRTTDLSDYEGILPRLLVRTGRPQDLDDANSQINRVLNEQGDFDVLWLDKGITIRPKTLRSAKKIRPLITIASYSPDDMTILPNRSIYFGECLPLYDVHFTTKKHNVRELSKLGARRVELVGNAYAPEIHRPMPRNGEDRLRFGGKVGFIGDYERDRAGAIEYLDTNGVEVRVWGPNWVRKYKEIGPNIRVENGGVYGDDYARAICNFDINLAFLRKVSRDQQTTRTMEITACGAFMLAERTEEHLELFEEGKEAEFFDSNEELLDKVRYYLNHEPERKKIATAGRERCLKSGYSNQERLKNMLQVIDNLREDKNRPY